jgi:hypothetical protein
MRRVLFKTIPAILGLVVATSGAPTSQPSKSEQLQTAVAYASAVLGLRDEGELLKRATDSSLAPENIALAKVEAICNRWKGPVLMSEFCQWLHAVRLADRLVIAAVDGQETGDGFTALPPSMHSLLVGLKLPGLPDEIPLLYLAVDQSTTAGDLSAELARPGVHARERIQPIVYSIRPRIFPHGFDIVR